MSRSREGSTPSDFAGALAVSALSLLFPASRAARADASAAAPPAVQESIEVTATRVPENPEEIPAQVTVISGEELERRNATTLAAALALVPGVNVAPGGDNGPTGSTPEMMGLHEFDAFLLVVDGVPWGGAFNPALPTLDLANVERIEVLRGSAPVLFGATSFIGVIQVIHRAPDATPGEARVSGGSYGSFGGAVVSALPGSGSYHQSITADYDKTGFQDDHTNVERGHVLYRGAGDLAGGKFRLDLDATMLRQDPASPIPADENGLVAAIPLDTNFNPSDRKQDEDRLHLVLGFDKTALGGDWSTTLAVTHANRHNVKGFLRTDSFDAPPDESNADGFRQTQNETDLYFDTHLAWKPDENLSLVFGLDELYGKGSMTSDNFEYHANLDGSAIPASTSIRIDERPHLEDTRSFAGLYLQAIWTPAPRWRVEAGARLNQTYEKRFGEVNPGDDGSGGEEGDTQSKSVTRPGGSLGASFLAFGDKENAVWAYADYRNTFKPAAIDFGPEAEGDILKPETADSIEGGLRGSHAGGRFTWDVSAFRLYFRNLVISTSINGLPALANAGNETLKGAELELGFVPAADWKIEGSYAYHDARYGSYFGFFGDHFAQVDGNRIELSAHDLASAGLFYLPAAGFNFDAGVNYVGSRFLDEENTQFVPSYKTWWAGAGYRFRNVEVRVDGTNLDDTRPPVAASELGDGQYYVLPARSYLASVRFHF